jgi:hypothetical protein
LAQQAAVPVQVLRVVVVAEEVRWVVAVVVVVGQ